MDENLVNFNGMGEVTEVTFSQDIFRLEIEHRK